MGIAVTLAQHSQEGPKGKAGILAGLRLAELRLFPLLRPPCSCSKTPRPPRISAVAAAHPQGFLLCRRGCGAESGRHSFLSTFVLCDLGESLELT